jgi:putative ABC transport system ATP-binding protein
MPSPTHASDYAARLATMFRAILVPDRAFFWQAVVFSIAISVLTLAVPLSVQILIGSVANTALLRPIVVLAVVLFALLAMYGLLSGVQAQLMDVFERRLFARITQEIALRSIHSSYSEVESLNREELANRFFEIITIQRNVPTLVVNGSVIALQAIVGFTVVAAYHPVFVVFNCCVLLVVWLVWRTWAGAAIRSKLDASKAKFKVAGWLEELGRANVFFKSRRTVHFALRNSEQLIASYVAAHRRHFRCKFAQQIGFLAVYAVASAALLGVGGWLVIENALSLGQLVAAELILSAVFFSLTRAPGLLEEVYEVCAALYKLGDFFELPLEPAQDGEPPPDGPAGVSFHGAVARYRAKEFRYDLELPPGSKTLLVASSYSAQKRMLDLLQQHVEPLHGAIRYGGRDITDLNRHALRDRILAIDGSGVLERSIADNLGLGDPDISRAAMRDMLAVVGLEQEIIALPDGLDTTLGAYGYPLSRSETLRLKLAAALLARPQVLILTQIFDSVSHRHRRTLFEHLGGLRDLTILNFSNRRDLAVFDRYVYLEPAHHFEFESLVELVNHERSRDDGAGESSGGLT